MKHVAKELIRRVESGENFKIDFKKKTLKVGKEVLIDEGKVTEGYEYCDKELPIELSLKILDMMYMDYKYSRPTEHDRQRCKYFKALRAEEMTDEQLCAGKNRNVCRAYLENYVLGMIINGVKWEDITVESHWYYEYNGLVLLKEWFE